MFKVGDYIKWAGGSMGTATYRLVNIDDPNNPRAIDCHGGNVRLIPLYDPHWRQDFHEWALSILDAEMEHESV